MGFRFTGTSALKTYTEA